MQCHIYLWVQSSLASAKSFFSKKDSSFKQVFSRKCFYLQVLKLLLVIVSSFTHKC